jgi:hypothetical protein
MLHSNAVGIAEELLRQMKDVVIINIRWRRQQFFSDQEERRMRLNVVSCLSVCQCIVSLEAESINIIVQSLAG